MANKIGVPFEGFAEFARTVAAQGAVLIQNEGQLLPLRPQEKVTVFGRCQLNYYRSGTGSGGAVNVQYTTSLLGGLRDSQAVCVNEEMASVYEAWIAEHPFDNGGGGWAAEPWNQNEMPLTAELVQKARAVSEKAVIVIGRTAGEDQDNAEVEGSYLLTAEEMAMLQKVTTYFEKTIVVLNVPAIIDMSWLKKNYVNPIGTVIYAWHGGMEGGNAIADVLTGKVTPSGKLADTIADSMASYPSAKNYGDEVRNFYEEDIYVGYRYFETFAPDRVIYEFGYGQSYTEFSIVTGVAEICTAAAQKAAAGAAVTEADVTVSIPVTVTNTGDTYSGKEVVQVYVSAPQGQLGKPARVLASFAKTRELAPGESQELTLNIRMKELASYDDAGVTGHQFCYVLEAGSYDFYVGNSIRQVEKAASVSLAELIVTEQLTQALSPVEQFRILKPGAQHTDGTFEQTYVNVQTQKFDLKARILTNRPETLPITGDRGIRLQDVADQKADMKDFIAQLSEEQLAQIVRGEGMSNPMVTPGTASAFGGVTEELHEFGIPLACTADGPSGIRMESGLKATQVPIGALLACTWDTALVEELYVFEGKELLQNQIDALLGPGMNLHRNPLNGRNFEYYSEDPLVTGQMAAAVVRGIMRGGSNATLKHFACNSQEKARSFVDAAVSERAVRELYLKGFEIAVKEGHANSIMTSYNPVNGHWAASNYDLNTTILRREWGFEGIVMTDWWAKMNDVFDGKNEGTRTQTGSMVCSQNDLYMVVSNGGAKSNAAQDDTAEALAEGRITVGELQRNAMNICAFLINAPVFARKPLYGGDPLEIAALTLIEAEAFEGKKKNAQVTAQTKIDAVLEDTIVLQVSEAGIYQVYMNLTSHAPVIAQSAFNLLMNGGYIATAQCGGLNGSWFRLRLANLELKQGCYVLSFENARPGLELGSIELIINN